jgi:hypothetical protein
MMKWWLSHHRLLRVCVPGGSLLLLGQCGLSDQQLTSIAQSVITTSLSTFATQFITTLFTLGTAAAGS